MKILTAPGLAKAVEKRFDWPKFASVIGAIVMAIAWVGFFAFATIAIIK